MRSVVVNPYQRDQEDRIELTDSTHVRFILDNGRELDCSIDRDTGFLRVSAGLSSLIVHPHATNVVHIQ